MDIASFKTIQAFINIASYEFGIKDILGLSNGTLAHYGGECKNDIYIWDPVSLMEMTTSQAKKVDGLLAVDSTFRTDPNNNKFRCSNKGGLYISFESERGPILRNWKGDVLAQTGIISNIREPPFVKQSILCN